jgi:hypothetical protein
MPFPHPFLEQIDHIGIQTDRPEPLYQFFTEQLKLPVAFPYTEYPFYHSGSVVLGNCFLEIKRFTTPTPAARYYILGMRVKSGGLELASNALTARGLPHSGLIPFYASEATDANPTRLWSNIYLGDLFEHNLWQKFFFGLTRAAAPTPSQQSPWLTRIMLALMARAMRHALPVLTEYHQGHDKAKQAADQQALQACSGGLLGVEAVREVVIGRPGPELSRWLWGRLLSPIEPDQYSTWPMGMGPAIRLINRNRAGLVTIVLKVAAVDKAKQALKQLNLLKHTSAERLVFSLPHTNGLEMAVVGSL